MLDDLPIILQWYVIISALGIIFLPLTHRFFGHFIDRGYILSKILGLLLISYTVWLLSSLHVAPFTITTISAVLMGWTVINILVYKSTMQYALHVKAMRSLNFKKILNVSWLMIVEELLLLAAFLFWVWVRGHEPSIHGLEKFMDYGFMNSISNTAYFPPADMWLAPLTDPRYNQGFFINYYYFGHYVTAFLTKLTSIPSEITYNLMLAQIFAWCFTASFSIGANLMYLVKNASTQAAKLVSEHTKFYAQILIAGLLAAFLVTMSGNLHTIYTLTSGYQNDAPVPFWQIFQVFAPDTQNPGKYLMLPGFLKYWYPNATRFIPNTIHEFPSYSWVVADLHGHVLDIPFVLLTIALLLAFITKPKQTDHFTLSLYHLSFDIWILLLLGLLAAVMFMTNAWDGAIYLALSGMVIMVKQFFPMKNYWRNLVINVGIVVVTFYLCSLPFTRSFQPFVHGVGVVGGWEIANALHLLKPVGGETPAVVKIGPLLLEKGNSLRSPIWMMSVLWGFFYVNVGIFIFSIIHKLKVQMSNLPAGKAGVKSSSKSKIQSALSSLNLVEIFLLLLIFLSTALLIFPEFFYVKDIYPAHYRANTMFKLGYQAFIMLSIVSGFTIIQLKQAAAREIKRLNVFTILLTFSMLLLTLVCIYPYFSIQSYYAAFKTKNYSRPYDGMDGIKWIKDAHPGDYETIQWFKKQLAEEKIMPQDVVLEAVGDSYTDYGRISSYTGLPTVLGWPVHEWLWRGSYDEAGKRVEEARQMYEATDTTQTVNLLNKFNIKYIVIGALEKEKYKNINETLIKDLARPVFSSGSTTVYQLN